jgi:hypothetical protein
MADQSGWRFCSKCHSLFFGPNETQSHCHGGGTHDGGGSGKYVMHFGDAPTGANPQGGWRFCHKCAGLFFKDGGIDVLGGGRTCAAGGRHDPGQSGLYVMNQGEERVGVQGNWRFCKHCFSLFFSQPGGLGHDIEHQGVCSADNNIFIHDASASGHYQMTFEIDQRQLATERIDAKYAQVGARRSPLGLELGGLQSNGQGFFKDYSGGQIVFTLAGDINATVTRRTVVLYKGIHCFGKSEAVDEPYAIVGVYAPISQETTVTTKFPKGQDSYTDFVASTDATDASVVSPKDTSWSPQQLAIVSTVMEHDSGDPDRVAATVENALKKAASDAGVEAGEVSTFTGILDDLAIPGLIASVLGVGDDVIGSQTVTIDRSELVPKRPMQQFGNIKFNFESPLLSDGDASYKLYYEVFVEETNVTNL